MEFPGKALRYIVEKGSIAIDGISLTVAAIKASVLELRLFPIRSRIRTCAHAKTGDL